MNTVKDTPTVSGVKSDRICVVGAAANYDWPLVKSLGLSVAGQAGESE